MEMQSLEECTFRPKILTNTPSKRGNSIYLETNMSDQNINNSAVFDRLYNEHKVLKEKKQNKVIKLMQKEIKVYTFTPKLIRSNSSGVFKIPSRKDNLLAQEEKKKEKLRSLILARQKQIDTEYTFSPKINKSTSNLRKLNKSCEFSNEIISLRSNNSNTPRYIQLNHDHKLKQERMNKRRIDYYNNLLNKSVNNTKSNSKPQHSSKSLTKFINRSQSLMNISVITNPSNYFEKLYDDANKMKRNKIKLSNEIYKETLTFSPKTNSEVNENRVKSTFEERNNKLIKLKSELANKINQSENIEDNLKNKFTKEEIETNNKNVVERLYMKEMEKIKEKNHNKKENGEEEMLNKLKNEHKIKFKNKSSHNKGGVIKRISDLYIEDVKSDSNMHSSPHNINNETEGYTNTMQKIENNSLNSLSSLTSKEKPDHDHNNSDTNFRSKALQHILKNRSGAGDTSTPKLDNISDGKSDKSI